MTQTIDQSEPMNFLLVRVSPRKEMGDHAKERKNSSNSARIEPTTSELRPPTSSSLINRCSTDCATRPEGSKSWVIMVVIAAL